MKTFVSVDNSLEVVLGVPEHKEKMVQRQREIEGFEMVYRDEHGDPEGKFLTMVFKKKV